MKISLVVYEEVGQTQMISCQTIQYWRTMGILNTVLSLSLSLFPTSSSLCISPFSLHPLISHSPSLSLRHSLSLFTIHILHLSLYISLSNLLHRSLPKSLSNLLHLSLPLSLSNILHLFSPQIII